MGKKKGVRSHCLVVDGLVAVPVGEVLIPGQVDGRLTRPDIADKSFEDFRLF